MAGMVVIYKKPADVKAFEKHYFETHIPLAKKIPGLRKYEISHGPVTVIAGPSEHSRRIGLCLPGSEL